MIQDGYGYGKSEYWSYIAKSIAKDEREACSHIDIQALIVKIGYLYNPEFNNVRIKVKCSSCNANFENTSRLVREKFLQFYS